MAENKQPYTHRDSVTGSEPGPTPNTEHRDTTNSSADERNEIPPGGREARDGYGPRTHKDTDIDEAFTSNPKPAKP